MNWIEDPQSFWSHQRLWPQLSTSLFLSSWAQEVRLSLSCLCIVFWVGNSTDVRTPHVEIKSHDCHSVSHFIHALNDPLCLPVINAQITLEEHTHPYQNAFFISLCNLSIGSRLKVIINHKVINLYGSRNASEGYCGVFHSILRSRKMLSVNLNESVSLAVWPELKKCCIVQSKM